MSTIHTINWDHYAVCYDALLHLTPYQELIQQACTLLNPEPADSILDIGCGTGNVLATLHETNLPIDLHGIDISPAMLRRAQAKCPTAQIISGNINQPLPYADHTFTKVVSTNALYTLTSPVAALKEMYRVLRPRGSAVITTPHNHHEAGLILKAHCNDQHPDSWWHDAYQSPEREAFLIEHAITDDTIVAQLLYVATHNRAIIRDTSFHFFSPADLTDLVIASGFTLITLTPAYAAQNICLVARKEI